MFSFSNHTTKRLFDKKIPSFSYDEVENLVEIGENGHNTTYTPYCHVEWGGGGGGRGPENLVKHFNFFEMKSGRGKTSKTHGIEM